MTDRYNPLVHEVNATVRMGAHPDGGYVLASDYNLLVTEHEKTEAELEALGANLHVCIHRAETAEAALAHSQKCQGDANAAVFRISGELATAERRIATLESEFATMTGAYLRVEKERDEARAALRKIVSDGDYTAPEGMKRMARSALETPVQIPCSCGPMDCNQRILAHNEYCTADRARAGLSSETKGEQG